MDRIHASTRTFASSSAFAVGCQAFLLRKLGFGDSDVGNSNAGSQLWIKVPVVQVVHCEQGQVSGNDRNKLLLKA